MLSGKLSRWLDAWGSPHAGAIRAPLLDAARRLELQNHVQSLAWSLTDFQGQATQPLFGDAPSTFRGKGLDFEENRAYQPGDEPRLLNWRLYARTGELYTRVFREERRPCLFLLVDRRAGMRFATRRQLKVTLAAGLACCHAWQAQQHAFPVGGLILNPEARWFEPVMGETAMEPLIQSLLDPCPPLAFQDDQLPLEEILQLLLQRLSPGCFLLLLSDFSDLDVDSAASVLHQLSKAHSIRAIQILDPVEQELPDDADLLLDDPAAPDPILFSGGDSALRRDYAEIFSARQAALTACFSGNGIPLHVCTTRDSVEACLDMLRPVNHAG